jgi:hypothetical protein
MELRPTAIWSEFRHLGSVVRELLKRREVEICCSACGTAAMVPDRVLRGAEIAGRTHCPGRPGGPDTGYPGDMTLLRGGNTTSTPIRLSILVGAARAH